MKKLLKNVTVLCAICCSFAAHSIERVYLRSGSTLVADTHKDLGKKVEIVLYSGAKITVGAGDIDKITIETSPPIDLSTMEFDPDTVLPDVSDPLNEKWLDQPVEENGQSSRLFLSFTEQLERGFENPVAKSMQDIKIARRKKVKQLEFFDRQFFLGMDMQYHDGPGLTFEECYERFLDVEISRNLRDLKRLILDIRKSGVDKRKESIVAALIELRDRLDPNYARNKLRAESWTAQKAPDTSAPLYQPNTE